MTEQEAKHVIEQYWKLVNAAIENGCCDESNFANSGCIYLYIKGGAGDNGAAYDNDVIDEGKITIRVDPYPPDSVWCYPVSKDVLEKF